MQTVGWYPVTLNTDLTNSPNILDPNSVIPPTDTNGNSCYTLTEFSNVTISEVVRTSYVKQIVSGLADGTNVGDNTGISHKKYSVASDNSLVLESNPNSIYPYIFKHNNISKPQAAINMLTPVPIQGTKLSFEAIISNHNNASKRILGSKYVANLYNIKDKIDFARLNQFTYSINNSDKNPTTQPITGETYVAPNANCINATTPDDPSCWMSIVFPDEVQPQNGWGKISNNNANLDTYLDYAKVQYNIPIKSSVTPGTQLNPTFEYRKFSDNTLRADNAQSDTTDWPLTKYSAQVLATVVDTQGVSVNGTVNTVAKQGELTNAIFSMQNSGSINNNGHTMIMNLAKQGKQITPTVPVSDF